MPGFNFFSAGGNKGMKQEPVNDDSMDYEPTGVNDSLFVSDDEDMEDAPAARASRDDGTKFMTVCNEEPYLSHPHHHRLMCGHDIMTETIQPCTKNCALAKYSDGKIMLYRFACPHPNCAIEGGNNVFMAKNSQGRKVQEKIIPCVLSHVYGRNDAADILRRNEKAAKTLLDVTTDKYHSARILENKKREGFERKRSQSPEGRRMPTPSPKKKKASPKKKKQGPQRGTGLGYEDPVVHFNNTWLANAGTTKMRDDLLKMHPDWEKTADGTRFKTRAEQIQEISEKNATSMFDSFGFDTKEERKEKQRKQRREQVQAELDAYANAMDTSDAPEQPLNAKAPTGAGDFVCNVCRLELFGSAFRCFDCDDDQDYDVCLACYDVQQHNPTHRLRLISRHDDLSLRFQNQAMQLVCECPDQSTRYLVICDSCKAVAFHPGCCGKGKFIASECLGNDGDSLQKRRGDWLQWKKEGKVQYCNSCFQAKENLNSLAPDTHVAAVADRTTRAKIRQVANLSAQIKALSKYYLLGEDKIHMQELKEAIAIGADAEIECQEEWLARLERQKFDEDLYNEDPIVELEPEVQSWKDKKRKRHDLEEEEEEYGVEDAVADADESELHEAKRARQAEDGPAPAQAEGPAQPAVDDMDGVVDEDDDDYEPQMLPEQLIGHDEDDDDDYEPEMLPTGHEEIRLYPGIPGLLAYRPAPAPGANRWGTGQQ